MTRVGFILKPELRDAGGLLAQLVSWLAGAGHGAVVTAEDHVQPDDADVVPEAELAEACDLAVVLGGDGTMLRAANLVADRQVPVLGIHLGRLGFLMPFTRDEALGALQAAVAGELTTSKRSRLMVTHSSPDAGEVTRAALNDAVVHQGAMARLIELEARLDGELIARYRADGLIISTPTGSTAYNLAAGGPIITPGQSVKIITPICAHALTNRPLVVRKEARISITLAGESRGVVLTVDGQWARPFLPGDRVDITNAAKPLVLFDSGKPYFDILREKLHWGARSDL
ncbi:MAG TPA: NAD(+)/NADH kinase [Kofleriaceae bacterium]|nr:NAD(+)/NADH kinase [Kofleriaceae bacterium]